MNALEGLIPEPQRLELDHVDVAAPPGQAWRIVRHGNLARSPIVRALFTLRTLPARLRGDDVEPTAMRIDDIVSAERPGFRLLAESELEVAVGAIGKVWQLDIPFVDVRTAEEFLRFEAPGYAKVAWALRVVPRGESGSRIEVEVRMSATDAESWNKFRRYFRIIGPASRFIRHHLLSSFVSEFGASEPTHQPLSLRLLRGSRHPRCLRSPPRRARRIRHGPAHAPGGERARRAA